MAARKELVVVAGPYEHRAAVAEALAGAARAAGREVLVHRWAPGRRSWGRSSRRGVSTGRRSMTSSVAVAAWHLAHLSLLWQVRWRWAARHRLLIVDGSFYDVLLRTDSLGLAKQLIRPGSVLAALAPRAHLVVLVDDAVGPRPRPAPTSDDWEPWTWAQLAPWMGAQVRIVQPSASASELSALLGALDGDVRPGPRWGRVPLRGGQRDIRVTPGPHAGQALRLFWGHRPTSRAVLAINGTLADHGALVPVVPPVDDLPDLCRQLDLDAQSIATARSRVGGRRMLGIVTHGRLAAVVKLGPADDAGLRREAEVLERLAGASPPLLLPRLRWAGQWRDRYVVATDAVANDGAPRGPETAAILDLCVAMASGGSWGAGVVHGDLAPWNLLATDAGLVLVDWENAAFEVRPMHDLTHFLLVRATHSRRMTPPSQVAAQLVGPGGVGRAYLERIGIDPGLAASFVHQYLDRFGDVYEQTGVPARYAREVRERV